MSAQKYFEVAADTVRCVSAIFYFLEEQEPALAGSLYFMAQDPYEYEFPGTKVQAMIAGLGSSAVFPEVSGLRYEVSTNSNALYIGADDAGAMIADMEADMAEGWTVEGESVMSGMTVRTATAKDGYAQAVYFYDAAYKELAIYFFPTNKLNPKAITDVFDKYQFTSYDVPIFDGQYDYVSVQESNNNESYFEYHDAYEAYYGINSYEYMYAYVLYENVAVTAADDYAEQIDLLGWDVVSDNGSYTATKEFSGKIGALEFEVDSFSDGTPYLVTFFDLYMQDAPEPDPEPAASWDAIAEELAEFLGDRDDSVPAFEGEAESFTFGHNFGDYIVIKVGEGNEDAAVAAYKEALEGAKYEPKTLGSYEYYISEHGEIAITVASEEAGYITITLDLIETSGIEELNAYITENGGKYTLPEIDAYFGEHYFTDEYMDYYGCMTLAAAEFPYLTEAQEDKILEDYFAKLDDLGWHYDEDEDVYFAPNYEAAVSIYFAYDYELSSYALTIDYYPMFDEAIPENDDEELSFPSFARGAWQDESQMFFYANITEDECYIDYFYTEEYDELAVEVTLDLVSIEGNLYTYQAEGYEAVFELTGEDAASRVLKLVSFKVNGEEKLEEPMTLI